MRSILPPVLLLLCIVGCYPTKRAVFYEGKEVGTNIHNVKTPAKVFLRDSSYVLFEDGLRIVDSGRALRGIGRRVSMRLGEARPSAQFIAIDSILAMTYYEMDRKEASQASTALLAVYGGLISAVAIHCVTCPKCCFGSCPTVYTGRDTSRALEAELFSYSLSKFFQEDDLDRLAEPVTGEGVYTLRLANEALETHYVDQMTLLAASHPRGTRAYPTSDGRVVATSDHRAPTTAVSSWKDDVTARLSRADGDVYRSGSEPVKATASGRIKDWIELEFDHPGEADSVTVVLRLKNTLLSTVLFYDVVLASQGIDAISWTERLNSDSAYAADYHEIYSTFSGVKIKTQKSWRWEQVARIPDVGPIADKDIAAVIPVDAPPGEPLRLRLEFFPDNVMIDYVALDSGSGRNDVSTEEIPPAGVVDLMGLERGEVAGLLASDDEVFLTTEPGEAYEITYELSAGDRPVTAFVKSNGYYVEWIRGDWIRLRESGYRFDLYRLPEVLTRLRESWLANREEMETRFFETRIPLRGGE